METFAGYPESDRRPLTTPQSQLLAGIAGALATIRRAPATGMRHPARHGALDAAHDAVHESTVTLAGSILGSEYHDALLPVRQAALDAATHCLAMALSQVTELPPRLVSGAMADPRVLRELEDRVSDTALYAFNAILTLRPSRSGHRDALDGEWIRLGGAEGRRRAASRVLQRLDEAQGPWWEPSLSHRAAGWWFATHTLDYTVPADRAACERRRAEFVRIEFQSDYPEPVDPCLSWLTHGEKYGRWNPAARETIAMMLDSVSSVFLATSTENGMQVKLQDILTNETYYAWVERGERFRIGRNLWCGRIMHAEHDWVALASGVSVFGVTVARVADLRRFGKSLMARGYPAGVVTEILISTAEAPEVAMSPRRAIKPAPSVREARSFLEQYEREAAEAEELYSNTDWLTDAEIEELAAEEDDRPAGPGAPRPLEIWADALREMAGLSATMTVEG